MYFKYIISQTKEYYLYLMHPDSAIYIKISRFIFATQTGFNSWVGNYLILDPLNTPTEHPMHN